MAAEGLCINEKIPNSRVEQPHPNQISLFLHSKIFNFKISETVNAEKNPWIMEGREWFCKQMWRWTRATSANKFGASRTKPYISIRTCKNVTKKHITYQQKMRVSERLHILDVVGVLVVRDGRRPMPQRILLLPTKKPVGM